MTIFQKTIHKAHILESVAESIKSATANEIRHNDLYNDADIPEGMNWWDDEAMLASANDDGKKLLAFAEEAIESLTGLL